MSKDYRSRGHRRTDVTDDIVFVGVVVIVLLLIYGFVAGCATSTGRGRGRHDANVVYSVQPRSIVVSDIGTLTIVLSMLHDCVKVETAPAVWIGFGGREAIRLTYAGGGDVESMGCGR